MTDSRSYQLIWHKNKSRFLQVKKPRSDFATPDAQDSNRPLSVKKTTDPSRFLNAKKPTAR